MYFITLPPHLGSERTYPVEKASSLKGLRGQYIHCGSHTAKGEREDNACLCGKQDSIHSSSSTSEAKCRLSCLRKKIINNAIRFEDFRLFIQSIQQVFRKQVSLERQKSTLENICYTEYL